jgi:hypothetical protein
MIQLARLRDEDFTKDGKLKELPNTIDRRVVAYAINWLKENGYGSAASFGPPEEPGQFSGQFHPELLTPLERQLVLRALELIRQATVQPGGTVEVRKP